MACGWPCAAACYSSGWIFKLGYTLNMVLSRVFYLMIIILLVQSLSACGRSLSVDEADKAVFLRVQDLVRYGYKFKDIEVHESFKKQKMLNGATELAYEFKTPEGEQQPLYINIRATVASKQIDASFKQGAETSGLYYGLMKGGMKQQELKDFYHYGDASSFYLLTKEGNPVGNYFTMRQGKKTYLLIVFGLYFDDPQLWKDLIEPKLTQFSTYETS